MRWDYHALGKAHADRGDHARAFDAIARGAQSVRSTVSHDRDRDCANAAEAEAVDGYSAAVGSAEPYRAFLEPFIAAYYG